MPAAEMNLQTFKAPTMAAALQQVKATMGHDAVILHTRTYQLRKWMGLRRREVVEITAGRGLGGARRPRTTGGPRPTGAAYGPGTAQPTNALAIKKPVDPGFQNIELPGRKLLETPAVGNALMMNVSKEVTELKTLVNSLVTEARQNQAPEVPAELLCHYMHLIQNEVATELARDIVQTLKRDLRPEMLSQEGFVRDKLAEQIEKLIPSSGPIKRKSTPGPHVIALIGPTGVGKTTTLAKLGANLQLKEKYRVGMITLDTYRIAAVDQLKRYADIIGSPLKVVASPEGLREAMASMASFDFVLIDTAGRSPNDVMKLNELRELLATVTPDEVHLVLSSTSGQACVDLAVERFSAVRVDKIIFTKLDEAAHVGVVLNVIRNVKKSLSYVTTGQNVPNDIEVGRGHLLARMILDANNQKPTDRM